MQYDKNTPLCVKCAFSKCHLPVRHLQYVKSQVEAAENASNSHELSCMFWSECNLEVVDQL